MQSMVQVCTPIKLEVQEHLVAMVYCAIVVALVLNEEGIIQDLKVHEGIVVFSVFHLFTGMPIIEKSVLWTAYPLEPKVVAISDPKVFVVWTTNRIMVRMAVLLTRFLEDHIMANRSNVALDIVVVLNICTYKRKKPTYKIIY